MTQSVELLLDDATEQLVRQRWERLADAGLPSMADHAGESNRPHVTLAVAQRMPADGEERLHGLVEHLPLTITLGGLVVFGAGRNRVLAWLVVPENRLLAVQAEAAAMMPDPVRHLLPGSWTPHVTLARRIAVERLGEAVEVLADLPEITSVCGRIRRWDSDARRTWVLD